MIRFSNNTAKVQKKLEMTNLYDLDNTLYDNESIVFIL